MTGPTTITAGRRVTPAARLVMTADDMAADRAGWLAARRAGIGSSDIPAIMGVVEQRTPLHVYYDKLGDLLDDGAGEAALWGTLHEETVAREWARRNRSTVRRVGLVSAVDEPWMLCSLDRLVTDCPLTEGGHARCALEVKTRSAWLASHWRRDVPDDVLAQTLWQLGVTGLDHIHVAVLIGGNDYRQRVVRPDAELQADIATVAGRLWHEHILAGRPPAVDGCDAVTDLYDRLNPDRGGIVTPDPDALLGAIGDYERARLAESAAKKAKAAAKSQLVELLGAGDLALMDDHPAVTYDLQHREYVDRARLAEHWPDAYADVVTDRTSRVLGITKPYRLRPADIDTQETV